MLARVPQVGALGAAGSSGGWSSRRQQQRHHRRRRGVDVAAGSGDRSSRHQRGAGGGGGTCGAEAGSRGSGTAATTDPLSWLPLLPACLCACRGDVLSSLREVDEQEDINKVCACVCGRGGGRACVGARAGSVRSPPNRWWLQPTQPAASWALACSLDLPPCFPGCLLSWRVAVPPCRCCATFRTSTFMLSIASFGTLTRVSPWGGVAFCAAAGVAFVALVCVARGRAGASYEGRAS